MSAAPDPQEFVTPPTGCWRTSRSRLPSGSAVNSARSESGSLFVMERERWWKKLTDEDDKPINLSGDGLRRGTEARATCQLAGALRTADKHDALDRSLEPADVDGL